MTPICSGPLAPVVDHTSRHGIPAPFAGVLLTLATLVAACGSSDNGGNAPDAAVDGSGDAALDVSGDTPSDASTSDADGADTDAEADAEDAADVAPDVAPDVVPDGCGDGVLDDGEECDDGNRIDIDGCRNDCRVPFCGDGLISTWSEGEDFDAPAVTNPDGVLGRVCGDGATCPARSCDVSDVPTAPEHGICQALGFARAAQVDWSGSGGVDDAVMLHAYNWVCSGFRCGASDAGQTVADCTEGQMLASISCVTLYDEACDDGADNADAPDACRTDCSAPVCGDGVVDTGEGCDDGNTDDTDACRNVCVGATCGDGVVDTGELCDDGAGNGDTSAAACRTDCTPARCGDGVVDAGEACDAGEANADADGAPCRTDCALPFCGDGWLDAGEACDDGNDVDTDACSVACTIRGCGDGVVGDGEACDDGNRIDDDGCTNACTLPNCGDGLVQDVIRRVQRVGTIQPHDADRAVRLHLDLRGQAVVVGDGMGRGCVGHFVGSPRIR